MEKYTRISNRGSWTVENLKKAIVAVTEENFSIRRAADAYEIPERTLHRRLQSKNFEKIPLGPRPQLGLEVETKLAIHLIELQKSGFPLHRIAVRKLAFQIAVKLNRKVSFNAELEMAGKLWLNNIIEEPKLINPSSPRPQQRSS